MHADHDFVEKSHHVLVAIAVLIENDIDDALSRRDFLCPLLQAERTDDNTALRSSVDNPVGQPTHLLLALPGSGVAAKLDNYETIVPEANALRIDLPGCSRSLARDLLFCFYAMKA